MINEVIQVADEPTETDYRFIIASNNGIVVLKISKADFKMTLSKKESYLKGQPVNLVLPVSKTSTLVAFIHGASHFVVINRESMSSAEVIWPYARPLNCTGAAVCPNFHADELSIIFVRDQTAIHAVNTQTWHMSTLVNLKGEGAKFADLNLLEVRLASEEPTHKDEVVWEARERDHELVFFSLDESDSKLVKRKYSYLLKYCLQTSSLRATTFKKEKLKRKIK